ncbi:uracil-DNA glycosylase family protein [Burkholderia cenocepacia]|uniref:uracil-DNA glycosylase family protein n=1 Tax=Burkholderia cenocepacia TaxID=95486 RepID=UPI003F515B46
MAPPSCASHPFRKRAMPTLDAFLTDVRACTRCAPHLPHGVQPVFQFHPSAPILIAGQAPGARVHASGVPFDDASGARLRAWLGVDRDTFYDPTRIAILPMGFCYPGTGKSGDLPLRPECAPRLARSLHAAFRAPVAGHRAGQLRHGLGVWGAMEPKTNVSSESHRKGAFRSPAHPPGITL